MCDFPASLFSLPFVMGKVNSSHHNAGLSADVNSGDDQPIGHKYFF